MTVNEFVSKTQKYYGEYEPIVKAAVSGWLQAKPESDLSKLFESLLKVYSNRWKTPPDVATLEDAWKKIDRGHPDIDPRCEYRPERLLEEGRVSEEEAEEYFEKIRRIVRKGREAGDGER